MAVIRIPLTQASPEGENSAYLLPDRGLVIDPGPPGEAAWDALRAGIVEAGADLETVEHVFVTHWHVDHAGSAVRLAEAADATLHMHRLDAPLVGEYAAARAERLERDAAWLRRWGVPEQRVAALRDRDSPSPFPDAAPVVAHADGDSIAGLRLVHTPGHTLGHAALVGRARDVDRPGAAGEPGGSESAGEPGGSGSARRQGGAVRLFAGDALLATYTPNVGGSDTRVRDAVSVYLGTLAGLLDADWRPGEGRGSVVVHPGHGESVAFPERVAAIREHHHERAEAVLAAVRTDGPVTPWAVASALFGEMRGVHAKMGAGEAAAHLARLHRLDRVERLSADPLRYDVEG